jgi:cytidylate kinase
MDCFPSANISNPTAQIEDANQYYIKAETNARAEKIAKRDQKKLTETMIVLPTG